MKLIKFAQIDGKKGTWKLVGSKGDPTWGDFEIRSQDGRTYEMYKNGKCSDKNYDRSILKGTHAWHFVPSGPSIADNKLLLCEPRL